MDVSVLEDLIR